MKNNPLRIQVGDVLFESSEIRKQIIEWKVVDIYIRVDCVPPRTVVVVKSEKFGVLGLPPSIVSCWHNTAEEANDCLEEMLE